jgi:protein-S-isoprenylcysteine O-methyltransferase Ste14
VGRSAWWRQIAAEERALAEKFGADYAAYRSSVPRWLDLRSFSV